MNKKALVAKSYQNLEQVSDIYTVDGRQYVKVRLNNGSIKVVRAYTEKQYQAYLARSNGEVVVVNPGKSKREIFGFGDKGFIYIITGNTYENLDWLRWSPCRYCRQFGWYLSSNEEMPQPMPEGLDYTTIKWEDVCDEDNFNLKSEKEVEAIIDKVRYPADPSQPVGEFGDKLELYLKCERVVPTSSAYGVSNFHIFRDENNNCFTWTTTARQLEEGETYHLRGKVKGHSVYHNCAQTILSNCRLLED